MIRSKCSMGIVCCMSLMSLVICMQDELKELIKYLNSKVLEEKYPELKQRLRASCPEIFQGRETWTFSMEGALKIRYNFIKSALDVFRQQKQEVGAGFDSKLLEKVSNILG